MASHSWTFDAPTGVYKNNKLSSDIRMAAIAEAKLVQFCKPEPGYGKKMGESINITRVSNISVPSSSLLTENIRISEDTISLSTQAITVKENGRAIPFTSLAEDLAYFDLRNAIQMKLKDQMKLAMDASAATAFKAGQVKVTPSGVASLSVGTSGVAPATASVNLNVYHVEQIRDYMYSTLNVEAYLGDDYMAVVSTKAKRGLLSDPAWEEWKKYTDPEAKFNGEIGRIENIRFVESNNTNSLSGSLGTGSVLGEAVFFGSDPCVMVVAEDPELRAKVPEDYGRANGVAWYGVYAFDQIWKDSANAGEARVVHVTSL